jgi:hypothetical protein
MFTGCFGALVHTLKKKKKGLKIDVLSAHLNKTEKKFSIINSKSIIRAEINET